MFKDFLFSLNATLPVFAIMVLGFLLRKGGFLTEGFCKTANSLVFRLCLPAMLLRQMAQMQPSDLVDGGFLVYAFCGTLVTALLFWLLARLLLRDKQLVGAFAQGSFRGNTALLGTVLLESICGSRAYAPLILLAAVPLYNVLSVILLSLEAGGGGKLDRAKLTSALKGVAKNPILWGIFLGLPFALFSLPIPAAGDKVLSMLGNLASPLSLIVIGAQFRWDAALRRKWPTLGASFLKLVALPGLLLPAAILLGFRSDALVALLVMSGTPSAVSSAIMAQNMDNDGVLANGIVAVTTLLSSVTVTGWIFLLRSLQLI